MSEGVLFATRDRPTPRARRRIFGGYASPLPKRKPAALNRFLRAAADIPGVRTCWAVGRVRRNLGRICQAALSDPAGF